MDTTVIIPARLESVRFPDKVLYPICGRPLILHVIDRVTGSGVKEIIVATDSDQIKDVVKSGSHVRVMMTQAGHTCGTDRIAEVAATIRTDFVLNVQGDELITGPEMINEIIRNATEELKAATLYTDLKASEDVNDISIVKVRTNSAGRMLLMSRLPIPFVRDSYRGEMNYFKQVGLYLFQREELLRFSKLKPTRLEQMEGIELLRAFEYDIPLMGIYTSRPTADVNLPSDVAAAEAFVHAHLI